MDLALVIPTDAWKAAPVIVLEPGSKAKFRMAIDLRAFKAAMVEES